MEHCTEADLVKLSVKELKSLARKRNVNPNSKKADLVKALLTNVKDIADHSENGGAQTSTRVTRSRVSIWQSTDETSGHVKETIAKSKDKEGNLNLRTKDSIDDKRVKRKRLIVADNIDTYDTSEMFPLVSSIQLASKSLVEINNKVISRHKQDKQDEFQAAVVTSKRSKQKKDQNKNIEDVLLTDNTGVNGVVSDVNVRRLTFETNEQQDFDLNNTFIVEKKRSPSQDVNRRSTKREQLEKEQANEEQNLHPSKLRKQIKTSINSKISKENQEELKPPSVLEGKNSSEKPKLGKKKKSESPVDNKISVENTAIQSESLETSNLVGNTHGPSKNRRKKGIKKNEFKPINKIIQDIENSPVEDLQKITDKSPKTLNSKIAQIKKVKLDNSEERKMRNSPLTENYNNSESSFLETDQNKSKSKKGAQAVKTNFLSNTENTKDERMKRGENKNQDLSLKHERTNTQELTDLGETSLNNSSSLQRSSRQSGTLPNFQNESTVVNSTNIDSVKKDDSQKQKNSNENILEVDDVSAVQGETGQNDIQVPIRSSTFILSDSGVAEEMPVPVLRRNGTFTLSDSDGKSPQRRSFRFSLAPASEAKGTLSKNADKRGKSIGHRIMQSSVRRGEDKTVKKDQGSVLKKTSAKNTASGSIVKKKATKLPDFKKIHQRLFTNMESVSENVKRHQDRGRGLLQSPIAPRCALLSPRPTTGNVESSPQRKVQNTKVKTPVAPSPLAAKLKTPAAITGNAESSPQRKVQNAKVKSPVAPLPLAAKLKTPAATRTPLAAQKPAPVAPSVNRFGFRKPVRKEEATSIIGKKLPSMNVEKKKAEDRNALKGVRTNKRFMLQMQMRQKNGQ